MNTFKITGAAVILLAAILVCLFPMASLVMAADDGITLSAPYGPPGIADTWERFTIPLTAETFDVDTSTFEQVMSNVTQFRIRTEMHTGNDIGGLDDVSVGTRHSSDFNRSLEGWSAAGDGTMEWIPSGGVSGGYLQISDWASGEWHWAVAPADWSGDWSSLIGSSIVFDMKTDQPSYDAVIEILSQESEWLILSADPMMVPPGGTSTVTVSPNPAASQELSVSLGSSDTSCITVPSSMTIGDGQSSGQFIAQAAPGAEIGCKSVITASVPGYGTSRITFSVGESPVIGGDGDPDVITNSPEADCIVLVGDIDNLGFGWPTGFDVFSGNSTPVHRYPWEIDPTDAPGTDRIMLGTSNSGRVQDGYSRTSRPDNLPQIISTSFNCPGVSINSAIIQMFVDDFQSSVWGSQFQVELNGIRAPFLESALNALVQTGPIGKLISVQVPSEYLYLLSSGNLSIYIDDPTTGAGDGYAVDFVRLLINPDLSASSYIGMITGTIEDAQTGLPLRSVKVSAGGTAETQTNSSGAYTLSRVPAGLVVVSASLPGYINGSTTADLVAGGNATANISLEPLPTGTGDTDGDGIPDNQDQCPNTSSGDTVGSNGCSGSIGDGTDSDGDGVPDSSDQCPNTPPGTGVGSDGCQSSGGAVSLVVESRTVAAGDTVTVPVRLENVQDVGSLNFSITYDSSVVKVSGVDKGSLLSGISFVANPNESGIIRFGFATENGINGTGSVGHIIFEAVGSAGSSSPLTVSGVEATDSSGSTVTLLTSNGLVTINNNGMLGDYNGDGLITELDALAALRMSAKLLAEDLILDMDQNGKVTAEDARRILSIAVRGS